MVLLARTGALLPALVAGAGSFLGFLLLAQRIVPALVALAGRPFARLGGVPARLAAGNAVRNPRRTAATATALVIGVTLTTAMVVGTSSTRATALRGMDAGYPTDVVVTGSEPLGTAAVDAVRAVEGVEGLALVDPPGRLDDGRVAGHDRGRGRPRRGRDRRPLPTAFPAAATGPGRAAGSARGGHRAARRRRAGAAGRPVRRGRAGRAARRSPSPSGSPRTARAPP